MAGAPYVDWVVPVYSGPSSQENLMTTLVGWARKNGMDPRTFHLWLENEGSTLVLRGFTPQGISDFLAYARAQSYPPLICGLPSQRMPTLPTTPPHPQPTQPPAAPPPPPPPADSSPLVQGVLQVLADRETSVRSVENRLMEIFGTLDLKESQVLWSLYLSPRSDTRPPLLALASTPSLRSEGARILNVPEEKLPEVLFSSRKFAKKRKPEPPAKEMLEEEKAKVDTFRRVLEANATHWEQVLARMHASTPKEGQMSAAVVVEEDAGKVTWVFPRTPSPVVRAISACVLHFHEGADPQRKATMREVMRTASQASRLAGTAGIALRWHMVSSGRAIDMAEVTGKPSEKDVIPLRGLLSRYGGATWILERSFTVLKRTGASTPSPG